MTYQWGELKSSDVHIPSWGACFPYVLIVPKKAKESGLYCMTSRVAQLLLPLVMKCSILL